VDSPLRAAAARDFPRLDRALAETFPDISRTRWKEYLLSGFVTVDGLPAAKADSPVATGAVLACTFPPPPPPEENSAPPAEDLPPLSVVYEDEALLVLDKQPGLVVHPACGHETGTLVDALRARYPSLPVPLDGDVSRAGIVHRLDMDTSGLILVAKTALAQMRLSAAFAAREIGKQYVALAWGAPSPASGLVDKPLERSRANRQKMAIAPEGRGRPARTRYETLAAGEASLLRLKLETGRTHQIRVHLASLGHPICGDRLYARKRVFPVEFPRQMLHAHTLRAKHPITGEAMTFCAPPPEDFATALAAVLPGYDAGRLRAPFAE